MKRCPFCGSTHVRVQIDNSYFIWCAHCGAKGPASGTPELAIKRWDTRIEDTIAQYIVKWSNERIISHEAYDMTREFLNGEMHNSILYDVLVKEFGE
ncbi:MAG: Lar family restriction alleviation protein [Proteobacteria bacterium]|jgi:Lar family restriction alleviation protein|nr:Lar family restriction alleviation protein [Pseudomonadota bacterium]